MDDVTTCTSDGKAAAVVVVVFRLIDIRRVNDSFPQFFLVFIIIIARKIETKLRVFLYIG